ncbi:uncharacterized protein LOC132746798 [Ruditapes philippinarum]|uniref:uncharacterized protein LOC132746798 n=1 Tax=Ruditapes philippinarum TaxID=129788 RepID=UPI00295AF4A9|nr:uncharacterized protein LOC132746798 [Ruditapes philippinarum]XP_060592032.1 uncharacterized protein LOC132746798 [Ruditapes philippinarum]XP_060592033.1 uncharacterized protein LOC132746798 [Ruditapes philippinarum]
MASFREISTPGKSGWDISKRLAHLSIGDRCNEWRIPVATWGIDEPRALMANIDNLDIKRKDWDRATGAVDSVLDMFLEELQTEATRFSGLHINKFIRQGSSREGLKVSKADEFDALLLFDIKGMTFNVSHIKDKNDWILPEFGLLVPVGFSVGQIQSRYPELDREGVFSFESEKGTVYLNSRNLHEKVFKSIVMRAANSIEERVNTSNIKQEFSFAIQKFSINPPSINIQIRLREKTGYFDYNNHFRSLMKNESRIESQSAGVDTLIDVDIVPGLELCRDVVPDPSDWQKTMECPRYAVFKWFTENQPSAHLYDCQPSFLWRMCSSGYEKHVLDASRGSTEQSYIVTALRIMKNEFRQRKEYRRNNSPLQVVTVLRSYHLKHIAFYCILYLTIMNKVKISGVRESLVYFLEFLKVCLEEQKLPHFFHANPYLMYMFPDCEMAEQSLRYDLLAGKSSDALLQAKLSFNELEDDIRRKYSLRSKEIGTYPEYATTFGEFVKAGKYYLH